MSELDKKINDQLTELYTKNYANKETGLTMMDRVQLIADGALMGWSDEAYARLASLVQDRPYEEIVRDIRIGLEQAKQKDGSFKYQLGGAFLPVLVTLPFSGATAPLSFGRLAIYGGVSGLTTAIGDQPSFGDMNPVEIGIETTISTVASPTLAKAVNLGGTAIKKAFEKSGGLSKKVEDKLMEIAEASNVSKESLIQAVLEGKTIPEISDQMAINIRTVYAKAPKAGAIISESIEKRVQEKPDVAISQIQKGLSKGAPEGNVLEAFTMSEKALIKAESNAYKKVFEKFKDLNNPEVDNLVLSIVNRINPKQLTKDINLINTMKGLPSVFKKNKDGSFELNRSLSLEEAENAYRVIRDLGEGLAKKDGKFSVASGVKELANELKNKLDEVSPDLKATRANYRTIKESRVEFDEGSKLLGNTPDKVDVLINQKITQLQNQPELFQAFKEGVANNIRAKIAQRGGKPAILRRIANPDSQEYKAMEKLFSGEEFETLIRNVRIATGALDARNTIKGNSITATALARQDAIKPTISKTDALQLGLEATSMNPFAIMRLVKFFFPNKVSNLSDDEMKQLAQLIINEDAELLQNALTNMDARNRLLGIVDRKIANLQKLSVTPTSRTATEGFEISPQGSMEFGFGGDENLAKEFLSGTSKGTQNKIMQSVNN